MIVIGAKGHAKEVMEVISEKDNFSEKIFLFDDVNTGTLPQSLEYLTLLGSIREAKAELLKNNKFVLGIGGTILRFKLAEKFEFIGGELTSVISERAVVSSSAAVERGVNIMPFSAIFGDVILGEGVLINSYASVHHDSQISDFSELSPGCRVLGRCKIGKLSTIGSNAVVLPDIEIGERVVVGAGSVVTKNLLEPGTYIGAPAKRTY